LYAATRLKLSVPVTEDTTAIGEPRMTPSWLIRSICRWMPAGEPAEAVNIPVAPSVIASR